jgi:His/Glu/Gln/Arg/opine family amino acid ABC transporter permease subunit
MSALTRNRKFREATLQAVVISLVATLLIVMVINARQSLSEQGMTSGFAFLQRSTGWDFSFSALEYSISDTYQRTLMIGMVNTLVLGFTGIFFATLIGVVIGLIRNSGNTLFSLLGTIYVEVFRNVPLILQAVFWYSIIIHLPRPKQAYSIGESVFLSGRGFYFPVVNISATSVLSAFALMVVLWIGLWVAREQFTRVRSYITFRRVAWIIGLCAIAALIYRGHQPGTPWFNPPALKGLNFRGGFRVPPELSALIIAIALYGGAYIGEVVRAGLMSVPKGQIEAATVLGIKSRHIFTRVRLPLAIRAVLPSLTNQYVQLMKATTIGLAIGFSDFFMIVSTSINQSGQTLELIAILMGGFLLINLTIAFVMNTINRQIALKGYEVKS